MRYSYQEFLIHYVNKNKYSPYVESDIVGGCNGLYKEKETPYRNISHWISLISEIATFENKYSEMVGQMVDNILDVHIENKPYKSRYSNKNSSNGLIGSAWIIEGLGNSLAFSNSHEATCDVIVDLCNLYPINVNTGIFPEIVEPDGSTIGLDGTFNHQLWLASSLAQAGAALKHSETILKSKIFSEKIFNNIKINKFGAVFHGLGMLPRYQKNLIKRVIDSAYRKDMLEKEWGYHAFNLLGLIRLRNSGISIDMQRFDELFLKLESLTHTKDFWKGNHNNKYGSTYNPVGIEVAVSQSHGDFQLKDICTALNYHFSQFFNPEKFTFIGSVDDPTLNARLYELTYLSDLAKNMISYDSSVNKWSAR